MTNNAMPRVSIEMTASTTIVLPKCPKTLTIEGGGQINTSALDKDTLIKIADLWKKEFLRKAGKIESSE